MSQTRRLTQRLGGWGGQLSLACAVHCLAMPLLLPLLPHAGHAILGEGLELPLLSASLLVSALVLRRGFAEHRRWGGLLLLAAACIPFAAGLFIEEGALGEGLVIAGSCCLLIANLVDHRLRCACATCQAQAG